METSAVHSSLDAGDLQVTCALAYTTGKPGGDCTGKHTLQMASNVSGATLKAELMGLDAAGNLLKSFVVPNGSTMQLASRVNQQDWKITKSNNKDYTVFAPVPLVKVTAEYNGDTAVAYCSNIPWVDVVQPAGGVVTEDNSGNSETKVLAAIPRTNPADLHLFLDGVDLLAPGVIAPALPVLLTACTFDDPCDGVATVNGNVVNVSDLVVDVAATIDKPSSNTLSATLNNLSCGSHTVEVTASKAPGSLKNPTSEACNIDNLNDKAFSSIFAIRIDDPVSGQVTPIVPTPVKGEICSGTRILDANINGKPLDVTSQVKTTPAGGDLYTYTIDTTLGQTDLRADFDGTTTELGTLTAGSNRLVAAAREFQGNRAYKRLIFAVGNNIKPLGIDPGATIIQQEALQSALRENLRGAVESRLQTQFTTLTADSTELKNAFIVALTATGAQTVMTNLCNASVDHDNDPLTPNKTPGEIFKAAVEDTLNKFTESAPLTTFPFEPPCSCNTTVKVWINNVNAGTDVKCPIEFQDGQITVSLELPRVEVSIRAYGHDSCFANYTTVDATSVVEFTKIRFDYTITQADILGDTTTVGADPFKVGVAGKVSASGGVEYGVLADVCNFFLDGFVTVLTFGQVDIGPFLYPEINIAEEIDFQTTIGPAKPNAIALKGIHIAEQTVEPYHQKMSGLVSEVKITGPTTPGDPLLEGAGITAGLKGTFATTKLDSTMPSTPGIEVKEAGIPSMASLRTQGAKDALVGLSEDAINMMFASLAGGGDMKVPSSDAQGCFATGATIGSLLPPDATGGCDSIKILNDDKVTTNDLATVLARGYCHAIKGTTCSTIVYNNPLLSAVDNANWTATEIGECWGAQGLPAGQSCADVSANNGLTWLACSVTPNFNLHANQNLMFCAKSDIPKMGFPNTGGPSTTVPTELQLNDLSVSLVIDRGASNTVDGQLATLPSCFSGTQTTSDCNVFAACMDINLKFDMNNITCPADPTIPGDIAKPGFQAQFKELIPAIRELGTVCLGDKSATPDPQVITAASNKTEITEPIAMNAAALSPPICGAGLSLGGFVTCADAKILAIDAAVDPKFREFLAITCKLQ